MQRIAITLSILLLACVSAFAQMPGQGPHNLVVVTEQSPSQGSVQLLNWIANAPELQSLTRYCELTELQVGKTMYEERYRRSLPPTQLPIIAFTDVNGGVIYKASGDNIPGTPAALAKAITDTNKQFQAAIAAQKYIAGWRHQTPNLFDGNLGQCPNCPQPTPTQPNRPSPNRPNRPNPLLDLVDEAIPDTVTVTPTVDFGNLTPIIIWIATGAGVLCMFVGGLFGLFLLCMIAYALLT